MRPVTFKLERPSKRSTRNMLIAAAVACALLGMTGMLLGSPASASDGSGATLKASLRGDLSNYPKRANRFLIANWSPLASIEDLALWLSA